MRKEGKKKGRDGRRVSEGGGRGRTREMIKFANLLSVPLQKKDPGSAFSSKLVVAVLFSLSFTP